MAKTVYKTPKIEELFEAGVHYGHQLRRWHPKMAQYIYTSIDNVHIINLEKTESKLATASEFLFNIAKEGGVIIFVGTKRQANEIIKTEAIRCGALHITEKWLGGTLTNLKVIRKNIDKLLNFLRDKEAGKLDKYTKKERLMIDREIEKLQRFVGGISSLKALPAAMFVIDAKKERTAVREANKANIPVVALIDTNSDPSNITYPIPGNDDAIKSIAVITRSIADAVEAGYLEFEKSKDKAAKMAKVAEEVVTAPSIKEQPVKITSSESPDVIVVPLETAVINDVAVDVPVVAVKEVVIEKEASKKVEKKKPITTKKAKK